MDKVVELEIPGPKLTNSIVSPEHVGKIWSDIQDLLIDVISEHQNEHTLYDVIAGISNGSLILWVGAVDDCIEAVSVFNFLNFPNKRVLNMMLFNAKNGNFEHKDMYVEATYNIAKNNGCNSIYFHGRCGWLKVLKEYGYTEIYRVAERKIQ